MEIVNFDKQFVERTKCIVEQHCTNEFPYDVTLLLNCLVGLINLPTEHTKKGDVPFKEQCVSKLRDMGVIIKSTDDKDKTFRAVRNAVSHMYIDPDNQNGLVVEIILQDLKNKKTPVHTELHFTIPQLKEFALFVASLHLKRFS